MRPEHTQPSNTEMLSPEEKRRITECERIKWIITGNRLPITWHVGTTPGVDGWFWDFEKNNVYGDLRDVVQKPDGYGQAVAIHEYAHVKISKPRILVRVS